MIHTSALHNSIYLTMPSLRLVIQRLAVMFKQEKNATTLQL